MYTEGGDSPPPHHYTVINWDLRAPLGEHIGTPIGLWGVAHALCILPVAIVYEIISLNGFDSCDLLLLHR